MLLAVDLHEDFIDVEGVAVALVLSLQSTGINRSEVDASGAYRFMGHSDTVFSQTA